STLASCGVVVKILALLVGTSLLVIKILRQLADFSELLCFDITVRVYGAPCRESLSIYPGFVRAQVPLLAIFLIFSFSNIAWAFHLVSGRSRRCIISKRTSHF